MDVELQKDFLLAQCRSMGLLLNARLGDANPWSEVDLSACTAADLAEARRLTHELLYAPPIRS